MKKRILLCLLVLLIAIVPAGTPALGEDDYAVGITYGFDASEQAVLAAPEISSPSVLLAEPESGKIIYEKNAHAKMYPASTTKLLTALLALEKCTLDETAVVSEYAVNSVTYDYSSAALVPGEELSVYVLLQAMLIYSANDAATVLAEHISGSVEEFAKLCNERAVELGCENLHFVNANGMPDDNHYCTAYDLFLIARECQKYDVFNEIVQTKSFIVPATELYPEEDRFCKNTNKMLFSGYSKYYYPYCTGMKTGYTTPAGHCLVSSASKGSLDLICVVLGGIVDEQGINRRYTDSIALFDFAYENYSYGAICAANSVAATADVKRAKRGEAPLEIVVAEDINGIMPKGFDVSSTEPEINLVDDIKAPISQNQIMGQITYNIDGVSYKANLVASSDVEKANYAVLYITAAAASAAVVAVIVFKIKKIKNRNPVSTESN